MRKVVLVFMAVALAVSGFAQKSVDLGIWGGSSTYLGDIKETPLLTPNLNLGVMFRYNFNPRVAVRTQFITGGFSSEGIVENVGFDFNKNAQDLSAQVEINFLRFMIGEKGSGFTPYIMGGLGIMSFRHMTDSIYANNMLVMNPLHPDIPLEDGERIFTPVDEQEVALSMPFGFGVKFAAGPRLGIGIEYQMRKLFSDKFDNLDDPLSFVKVNVEDEVETVKYTTFWHNNDWPGYLGVYVTYKFELNKRDCPAYDRKYW